MKEFVVQEKYVTIRTLRVLATDAHSAKNWDVSPKALVLDYGNYREKDFEITAEEKK